MIKQPEQLDFNGSRGERMPFRVQICSTFTALHPLLFPPFRLRCDERLQNCGV